MNENLPQFQKQENAFAILLTLFENVGEEMTTLETMAANDARPERSNHRAYRLLNEQWPKDIPPMTDRDVKFAARVLYRKVMGKKFTGTLTVKHRGRSWVNRWRIIGNSHQGWHSVVHDWSHDLHKMLYPKETPHGPHQAYIERTMVEEVVARGWLTGRLNVPKVEKPKPSEVELDLKRTEKLLKKWKTKQKRAATAIAKLERQQRNLLKRL